MYSKLTYIDRTLKEVVSNVVNEQLQGTMLESIQKKANKAHDELVDKFETMPQLVFNKAINTFMRMSNHPAVDKEVTDEILKGNAGAIAKMLHQNCGLDYAIGLGLVGILKNDPVVILDSIYKVSLELDIDPIISVTIAELVLDKYNSDKASTQKVSASIILSVKKLIRHLFPAFPSEMLDIILEMVLWQESKHLKDACEHFGIPKELVKLIFAFISRKQEKIYDALLELPPSILPESWKQILDAVYQIMIQNMGQNFGRIRMDF